MSGEHDDRRGGRPQFDDVGHFQPGHPRHRVVGHDRIMEMGVETSEGIGPTPRGIHYVAELIEEPLHYQATVIPVVNQENRIQRWIR